MSSRASACSRRDTVRVALAGERYLVECDDDAVLAPFARWAAPLSGDEGPAARWYVRSRGEGAPSIEEPGRFAYAFDSVHDLVPALEGMLYARLARRAPALGLLHAAAMARHGKAVLFFGPSGTGKSVLSLTLCSRGWTYLSDEFAPIDAQLRVTAVPRPVAFRADEIPAPLFAAVSRGRTTWTHEIPTDEGPRTALYVLPERRAVSGASYEVGAVVRLEPRRGAQPRWHRLNAAAARAFLFGVASGLTRPRLDSDPSS